MSKVISIANMKGGVGKTTASVAIAEATPHIGKGRTLVIDLDPQINASHTLSGSTPRQSVPWLTRRTIVDYLSSCATPTPGNPNGFIQVAHILNGAAVSYLSGSIDVLTYERQRLVGLNRTIPATQSWFLSQVDRLLDHVRPNYALVIFDCPPGLSLLTEAALTRSDKIIIPVSPTHPRTKIAIGDPEDDGNVR
jgi:chromosome partitioning protein